MLVQQIWGLQLNHVLNSKPAVAEWAELWAPRTPLGSNWERITTRVRELKDEETLAKLLPIYATAVRAAGADKANPQVWRNFYRAAAPQSGASALANVYDLMGTE